MDSFLDGYVRYLLIDLDPNSPFCDVPHSSSPSMVEFVRHAYVYGGINLDINVLSKLVCPKVRRQRNVTLHPEGPREEVSRPLTKTVPCRYPNPPLSPHLRTREK
ncbi:hypothetical protein MA16_Dca000491 [Dendrobium catenatum]|uniref:Uncharacterized protein n=1 Tax=Dendrobium catenatum TaxID=906689 RepID=A0A2I0WU21_9ASPA|nr:hypothetical protein MA16_Dca000491 [Dendrobium catenatum]